MVDNITNSSNTNTQNQNNDTSSENSPNNSASYTGGGKKMVVGIDRGGRDDQSYLETVAKGLEDCGNEVVTTGVDPNQEGLMKGKGADVAVFLCNGVGPATIWSFWNAIKAGSLPFTIFAFEGWYHNPNESRKTLESMENVRAVEFFKEHDADQFMSAADVKRMAEDANGAKTIGEWADMQSQYLALCWAKTPEEMASTICSGACGGGGGSTSSSGSSAQIKDKTFEHCVKRICAATDSIFLVENNAAVLFPYTDWMAFTLRQQINSISASQMDPDLFEIDYNTEGFYNKVTTVWGADEGSENIETEDNTNNSNTEEKKTIGNVTTIQKKMPTGGTQLSEQYDPLVSIYGELEKKVTTNFPNEETAHYVMNALLIQYIRDFNNSCRVRAINNQKFIGGTFYAVENPNTKQSELYYLNSYTIFKNKDEPITIDMEFKYGPEGAEELLDYQSYGGGGGTTTGDSSTEEQIWKNAQKACHQWTCEELRESESDTQDPAVAEKYYNEKVKAGEKFCLTCYGMSSWLYYQFNNKASIPCRVIGNSEHHVVELYKNNSWYKPIKEYSTYLEEGYRYNGFCKGNAPVLLEPPNPPAGSNTSSVQSGTTANQNA